jgi:hypothetical protein
MLNRKEIEQIALNYLSKNNFPVVINTCRMVFPNDEQDLESKDFLLRNNFVRVSFESKYYDDPYEEYPCDPGIYIVYVNISTGEVHMPRHV